MAILDRNRTSMYGFILSAALAAVQPLPAFAEEPHQFEIASPDPARAIHEFGTQSGVQILASAEQLAGKQLNEVTGTLSTDAGLKQLLAGTGLTHRYVGERTVALVQADAESESKATQRETSAVQEGGFFDRVRLAQVDRESSAASPSIGQSDTLAGKDSNRIELEEIVVTGSHIRGSEPAGSKVTILTREEISRSGYGRIEDVITTLTQNFKGGSEEFNQAGNANTNFGAEIQFRGLGTGTTLTLVNGIRQTPGGSQGAFVDMANIPIAAIERVEILTDGASAIYGSDAIGGVANIILRDDFEGAETRARYATAGGEGDELSLSQSFGTSWGGGSALLGYQYLKKGDIPATSREYSSRNGDMTSYGGSDFRVTERRYQGSPGTILCPAGRSDCVSGQPAFAIPAGQDGSSLTPAELIPGGVNYTDIAKNRTLVPDQEMHSLFFAGSQTLSETWELFGHARFNRRNIEQNSGARRITAVVPATNPFYVDAFGNGQPLRVAYDLAADMGPATTDSESEGYQAALGAAASLPNDWQLKLSASFGRERNIADSNFFDSVNATAVASLNAALADTNPATALNVFGDGDDNNPETLARLQSISHLDSTTKLWNVGASLDGPVFRLPGGDARLAVGNDVRHESLSLFRLQTTREANRDVYAAFTELSMPFVSAANSLPGLRRVEMSLAARYERYSDFGETVDPKIGLTIVPINAVALRGTWGTSFRAPAFYQSNPSVGTSLQAVGRFLADPQSPTGTTKLVSISGSNSDLKEETADAWTAGMDIVLPILPQLRTSLTYFHIDYENKIQSTIPNFANEDLYTGLIIRNPTQDQLSAICANPAVVFAAGDCTGPIGAIFDQRLRNIASVRTRGLDADIAYSQSVGSGSLDLNVGGTYVFEYSRAFSSSAPATDVVDTVENPLALRLRASAKFSLGHWFTGATILYTGEYRDSTRVSRPPVDAFTTLDVVLGYRAGNAGGILANSEIQISGVNVTDEIPPFVNQDDGYDGANFSIIGRLLSLQLIKTF